MTKYLIPRLQAQGIQTSEPITEDWGYYIPLTHPTFKLALCCASQMGSKSTDTHHFRVFYEPLQT